MGRRADGGARAERTLARDLRKVRRGDRARRRERAALGRSWRGTNRGAARRGGLVREPSQAERKVERRTVPLPVPSRQTSSRRSAEGPRRSRGLHARRDQDHPLVALAVREASIRGPTRAVHVGHVRQGLGRQPLSDVPRREAPEGASVPQQRRWWYGASAVKILVLLVATCMACGKTPQPIAQKPDATVGD